MADPGTVKQPGMDDGQAQKDRGGFDTTVEQLTGHGPQKDFLDGGGPQVGNPYDDDPMGEEYKGVSHGK